MAAIQKKGRKSKTAHATGGMRANPSHRSSALAAARTGSHAPATQSGNNSTASSHAEIIMLAQQHPPQVDPGQMDIVQHLLPAGGDVVQNEEALEELLRSIHQEHSGIRATIALNAVGGMRYTKHR